MDRVIIKKLAENINVVEYEMPDIRPDTDESDWKGKMKLKRRKFRPEPGDIHEQLLDGQGDQRNQFRGVGTENSYDTGFEPTNGW